MTARPLPPRRPPPPRPAAQQESAAPPPPARGPAQAAPLAARPQPQEEERPLPQTFFVGRYRVVDEIGTGGMASVHLARVDGPGGFQKWVAIKRIHPHLVEDDQFVDMFLDEARIAAGINHANVAQVFDLGKDDNTYWIAMEYLHGEPLREMMRRIEEYGGTVPFHIAARICADAAEGLHGAHELRGRNGQLLNLVHRDVTPHNLFVTYDGYTKVVDFGIAKVVDRLASTRAGTLKGKLAYMSPEQVRGQEVDRRTDIFALGVVLWELTTNRRLFRMDTDLDTLERVQACVVPLPSTIVPGYPAELEQVVMKALAQRREDRFQTAREFSRALQSSLMRQGLFVAPEDVGDYLKQMFADRVNKRERYLEWAAEMTGAVDISQLHGQAEGSGSPHLPSALNRAPIEVDHHGPSFGEANRGYGPTGGAGGGMHAPAAAPPELAASSLMDEDEDIPTQVATEALMSGAEQGHQSGWSPATGTDGTDFESTIAMVDQGASAPPPPQRSTHRPPPPSPAMQAAAAYPTAPPPPTAGTQAAIETKMSLPRPAALADFLVEQGDIAIPPPRTTEILVALALLATLCVIGIGALVIYKLQHPAPTAAFVGSAETDRERPSSSSTSVGRSAAVNATDAGSPKAEGAGIEPAVRANSVATGKSEASAATSGPAPGQLTVDCKPGCDSVSAGGRSLGPSPVVGASLPPGAQRVTLKRGSIQKTIVVNVESGQLTTQTVTMN